MISSVRAQSHSLPTSVAIIMDGNRRWAERRGIDVEFGHIQGSKTAENIIRYAFELGIQYLTLFAFSSENWRRPASEINSIMKIIENYLVHDTDELIKRNIRVCAIGDVGRLPKHLHKRLDDAIKKTASCSKFCLNLALSYGAWEEMVHACREIAQEAKDGTLAVRNISEELLNSHLFTKNIPHPDLFIRTSGELRLSNFLLLQMSYSELYFTPTLWPDFRRQDFDQALASFKGRNRRFGGQRD